MTTRLRYSQMILALLAVTGCASNDATRSLARHTGAYVQTLATATNRFIELQREHNKQNAARLTSMNAAADEQRGNARQQQFAWTDSGDTTRRATFERATALSPDAVVASLKASPVEPPVLESGPAGYEAAVQALAKVTAKPKASTQLEELVGFVVAVHKEYGNLQDKAAKDAQQTQATTEKADRESTTAGLDAANRK